MKYEIWLTVVGVNENPRSISSNHVSLHLPLAEDFDTNKEAEDYCVFIDDLINDYSDE